MPNLLNHDGYESVLGNWDLSPEILKEQYAQLDIEQFAPVVKKESGLLIGIIKRLTNALLHILEYLKSN